MDLIHVEFASYTAKPENQLTRDVPMTEDSQDSDLMLTAEISGPYETVVRKLQPSSDAVREHEEIRQILADLAAVLDAVQVTGGGVHEDVMEESEVEQGVGHLLRILATHDLVELDERTWKPGPALRED
jgi:hypothetical protein